MSRLSAGAGFRRLQPQRDFQSPKDSTGFQPVVINRLVSCRKLSRPRCDKLALNDYSAPALILYNRDLQHAVWILLWGEERNRRTMYTRQEQPCFQRENRSQSVRVKNVNAFDSLWRIASGIIAGIDTQFLHPGWRVVRFIPMRVAAPSALPTRPLVSMRALTIWSRCFWTRSPAILMFPFSALIVSFTMRATSS